MPTLRQFTYLDALARHRHFGRAAESAAVSQPALSMQIKELEAELGLVLVERTSRGARLTAEGEAVAARAAEILSAVRDLVAYARHRGRLLAGRLRLGVIPSVAPYLLPRLLPVLHERHPTIELEVRETQTRQLTDELLRGDLDLLILALPVEDPGLVTLPLFEDRFLLAVPATRHDLPARADETLLRRETILLLEEGHCLRDQALGVCERAGAARIGGYGATSLATLVQMVANGYGVTLLPELAVEVEGRDPRLGLVPFDRPQPSRNIGLVWRKRSPREADFEGVARLVREVVNAPADRAGAHLTDPVIDVRSDHLETR